MHEAPVDGVSFERWLAVASVRLHKPTGLVAEWLCSGLQSRVRRFNSDPGLHLRKILCDRRIAKRPRLTGVFIAVHYPRCWAMPSIRPGGEIGRRIGLKIRRPRGHTGSIPVPGTIHAQGVREASGYFMRLFLPPDRQLIATNGCPPVVLREKRLQSCMQREMVPTA